MTLLEEIQNSAVDAKSDLGTLLRKCKLLASRLGSQPLEDWLVWESNGYPENVDIPEYRAWPLELRGHFSGPFGSGIRNASIPLIYVPEEARKSYERFECRQSIATIEESLATVEKGFVQVSTQDLVLALGTKVYESQNCVQVWAQFSTTYFVELTNAVRNRILDFSLALWKTEPLAGQTKSSTTEELGGKVTQIFHTTVYGGSAHLLGSAHNSTVSFQNVTNDFEWLAKTLRDKGLKDEDIAGLRTAIEADKPPSEPNRFGPKVSSWIAAMIEKAANGSWQIGLEAGGTLLAQAIAKYYGL